MRTSPTEQPRVEKGQRVSVVQKQDQRSGKLTTGVVKDILTKSHSHPHGIKVRLENGIIGRVKSIHPAQQTTTIKPTQEGFVFLVKLKRHVYPSWTYFF